MFYETVHKASMLHHNLAIISYDYVVLVTLKEGREGNFHEHLHIKEEVKGGPLIQEVKCLDRVNIPSSIHMLNYMIFFKFGYQPCLAPFCVANKPIPFTE